MTTDKQDGPADPLSAAAVQEGLNTLCYGRSLQLLAETGSTNDDARRAALAGVATGHVIVADHQTAGRGSRGRHWSCSIGTDLYLSIVDRPTLQLADLPPLTLAVGLGVADTVATFAPDAQVEVKWPNDVWLDRHKCAGILVEASTTGEHLQALVIGIGLNVNRVAFASTAGPRPTSLRLHQGKPLPRNLVLAHLLNAVETWVRRLQDPRLQGGGAAAISAALQPRLAMQGHVVQCDNVRGTLLGVTPTGALRILTTDGERQLISGRLQEDSDV